MNLKEIASWIFTAIIVVGFALVVGTYMVQTAMVSETLRIEQEALGKLIVLQQRIVVAEEKQAELLKK